MEPRGLHRRAVSVAPQLSPAIATAAAATARACWRLDCTSKPKPRPKPEAVGCGRGRGAVESLECSAVQHLLLRRWAWRESLSSRCPGACTQCTAVLSNANSVYLPPGNSNLTQLSSPAAAACALSLSIFFLLLALCPVCRSPRLRPS
jgi:hypothetical protein